MKCEHIFIPVEWFESEHLSLKEIRVIKIMCQKCTQFRIIKDEPNSNKS